MAPEAVRGPDARERLIAGIHRGGSPLGLLVFTRTKVVQGQTGRWRPPREITPLVEHGDDESVEKFLYAGRRCEFVSDLCHCEGPASLTF
jgi:hypothetical protein